jgi:hypothetical protein
MTCEDISPRATALHGFRDISSSYWKLISGNAIGICPDER